MIFTNKEIFWLMLLWLNVIVDHILSVMCTVQLFYIAFVDYQNSFLKSVDPIICIAEKMNVRERDNARSVSSELMMF